MLSCWHDLLFLLARSARNSRCLLLFYLLLLLPSMGWLCGVGVFGLMECSHSLAALHSGLQLTKIIIIIIMLSGRLASIHESSVANAVAAAACVFLYVT